MDPVLLSQWLINGQSIATEVHAIFTYSSCVTDPSYSQLNDESILSKVNLHYLALSPFEIHQPGSYVIMNACTQDHP